MKASIVFLLDAPRPLVLGKWWLFCRHIYFDPDLPGIMEGGERVLDLRHGQKIGYGCQRIGKLALRNWILSGVPV